MTLDIDTCETGLDLKVRIFQRIGILPRLQWLSTGVRIVEDWHYLVDRDIVRDATVLCHLRAGGGPCEICSGHSIESRGDDETPRRRSNRTYIFYAPQ